MSYTRALGLARALNNSGLQARLGWWNCFVVVPIVPDIFSQPKTHSGRSSFDGEELGPRLGLFRRLMNARFRGVQIQSLPSNSSQAILNKQRLRRPSSPHFTIYQPQLTWISSIANRFTGVSLSVCEYTTFATIFYL